MLLTQNQAATKTFAFASTGLTIGIQLAKAGSAFADPSAGSSTLTDAGGGVYTFALSTTDTDTIGNLDYSLTESGTPVAPLAGDMQDSVVTVGANAKDLITLTRAYYNLPGVSNDSFIAALITSVSDAIEKYCRRSFYASNYDELYNGNGQPRLLLRAYPIQHVDSVRYRPVTVLKVTNTDAGNVQARVAVTSTGLTLTRVKNGVKTIDTSCTFSSNVTLGAMATAVSAVSGGWSAQAVGDANYSTWPSADLYWPSSYGDGLSSQGALQCVAGSFAELKMHTYELAGYQFDTRGWLLRAIPYTDPELLHPEDLVWPVGINNLRVQYTAGYTTIPESVQEACAEWVSALYNLSQRDPTIANKFTGSAGTAYATLGEKPPANVLGLLAPYRRRTISTDQG